MFKIILVPLDGSALAEQAIGPALMIARNANARVQLLLVHQPMPLLGFADVPWSADASSEESYLRSIANEAATRAPVPIAAEVAFGDAGETLCERARELAADLIVMTSHGRTGLRRVLMGSIAERVLRESARPVLLLRSKEATEPAAAPEFRLQRMLVTLDGSEQSEVILRDAMRLAQCFGARVTLLRILQPVPLLMPEASVPMEYIPVTRDEAATRELAASVERTLDETATRLAARHPSVARVDARMIVADDVAREIVDFVRGSDIDLVAMSTRGRGASRLFLGSVAQSVAKEVGVPMLLRRATGNGQRETGNGQR